MSKSTKKLWRRPLDAERVRVPQGEVHIIEDRCKGCGFCVAFCPKEVLEMSEEFNVKGYHFPQVKNDGCVNCHLCGRLCPDFAIFSTSKDGHRRRRVNRGRTAGGGNDA